jgi:hypothetical protein
MIDRTPRLFLPMLKPEDVIPYLAKGEKHWRVGFSAHALATTWFAANGIPPAVHAVLQGHDRFRDAELVDGIFERKTCLQDDVRGESQTDLLAILGIGHELAVAAVEGKVDESFGPLVSQWLTEEPDKQHRMDKLVKTLEISNSDISTLRYQLFHRTAAAIYEAKRYRASVALLLVHSFSTKQSGWTDYAAFVRAMGFADEPERGKVLGPKHLSTVELYTAWVADTCPN